MSIPATPRVHVVPLEDHITHFQDGQCCNAFLCEEEAILIHHSADKQEQHERQGHQSRPWAVFLHELMERAGPTTS